MCVFVTSINSFEMFSKYKASTKQLTSSSLEICRIVLYLPLPLPLNHAPSMGILRLLTVLLSYVCSF